MLTSYLRTILRQQNDGAVVLSNYKVHIKSIRNAFTFTFRGKARYKGLKGYSVFLLNRALSVLTKTYTCYVTF